MSAAKPPAYAWRLLRIACHVDLGTSAMKNAHLRFGKLVYVRRSENTATNIRVHLDPFVGEERGKAHLVSVAGGDIEIGALLRLSRTAICSRSSIQQRRKQDQVNPVNPSNINETLPILLLPRSVRIINRPAAGLPTPQSDIRPAAQRDTINEWVIAIRTDHSHESSDSIVGTMRRVPCNNVIARRKSAATS